MWVVDARRAPAYWFPRLCPRMLAWAVDGSTTTDVERILGPAGATRVHAVEYVWLERTRTTLLYVYRFPSAPFRPWGEREPSAHVAEIAVRPTRVVRSIPRQDG